MFVKVADGPGLGDVPRNVPLIVRTKHGAVIRVPLMVRRRGMGDSNAGLYTRPGAGGVGTQIVDASGNTVYSADYVAQNPSILSTLGAVSGCRNGTMPVWFPGSPSTGGGAVCADPGAIVPGEGNSPYAQFEYPVNGQCNPNVWCMFGSDPNNPSSYVWTGNGAPTVMNPALVRNAGTPFAGSAPTLAPIVASVPVPVPMPASTPFSIPVSASFPMLPPVTAVGPPPVIPASVSIANTSRPGQPLQVGDAWKLVVKGTPNQPVAGTVSQDGNSLGTTTYGTTDQNGQLVLTGSMDASTVGKWTELWTVGTVSAPVLNFTVAAAPAAPGGAGSPPAPPAGGSSSSTTGGGSSFFDESVSIGSVSIPIWAIIAVVGVGGYMLSRGKS